MSDGTKPRGAITSGELSAYEGLDGDRRKDLGIDKDSLIRAQFDKLRAANKKVEERLQKLEEPGKFFDLLRKYWGRFSFLLTGVTGLVGACAGGVFDSAESKAAAEAAKKAVACKVLGFEKVKACEAALTVGDRLEEMEKRINARIDKQRKHHKKLRLFVLKAHYKRRRRDPAIGR